MRIDDTHVKALINLVRYTLQNEENHFLVYCSECEQSENVVENWRGENIPLVEYTEHMKGHVYYDTMVVLHALELNGINL